MPDVGRSDDVEQHLSDPRPVERENRMAILARRQYGVVAHDQLLELGFTPPAIRYRLRCARLRMVHPRVYAVGAQPLVAHGHWYAALLACRPDPVLSHLSSAAKRGLAKERSGVHVTTTNRSARRLKGVTIHRCRRLDPADVERIDGLPVTTLPRMFLDLAETAPFDVVRGILEEAERRELLDLNAIDACIARNPGRRGIAPLSRLLAIYMPIGTANEGLEVDFTRFVAELGLPSPLCNTLVDGLLVDFYWPQARLVVELDSRGFHAHWAAAERDRMRDAQLMRLGIHTLRVTGRRLNHDRAALFGDIAARFAATGHPLDR